MNGRPFAYRIAPVAAAALCAGCVSSARLPQERAGQPVFDPIAFFTGHTHGTGTLRIAFKSTTPTLVEGAGRIADDGGIDLDQTVRQGDDATTRRHWHLRRTAPGRYEGTLSDASGPVTGDVAGNRLHLAFAMKGGLKAEQWLYLQPGGSVAHNVMVVRKFGVAVARVDETITRTP